MVVARKDVMRAVHCGETLLGSANRQYTRLINVQWRRCCQSEAGARHSVQIVHEHEGHKMAVWKDLRFCMNSSNDYVRRMALGAQ